MVITRGPWVAAGLVLDQVLGEPPTPIHPVAAFGTLMNRIENVIWRDQRTFGALYASSGVAIGALSGVLLSLVLGEGAGLMAATTLAAAGRSLLQEAQGVGDALRAGDLEAARVRLPALVGRNPEGLEESEIARAVVESVAENLSDAVIGTAVWGILGGAPGVCAHRAVNTLDAMVGHRTDRYGGFGWAAARLDDVMGWPAARTTALLVVAVSPTRASEVLQVVRRDAGGHPSPNAGVAEAAFAAALGVRLGGPSRYGDHEEVRPTLGNGRAVEAADIDRAVRLARKAIALCAVLLVLPTLWGLMRTKVRR